MRSHYFVFIGVLFSLLLFGCGHKQSPPMVLPKADTVSVEEVISEMVPKLLPEAVAQAGFFKVDEVEQATRLQTEHPFKAVFEDRIEKEIYQLSETDPDASLIPARMNGFVQTVYSAYAEHRPLSISPDDVWLLIAQGFSIHANEEMELLESKLFVADKPDTLKVRNDSLAHDAPGAWQDLLHGLSAQVGSYTQPGVYATLVPHFSTTTVVEQTVFEVTMLETASKVFTYAGESGCGIPSIRLEGTVQDWEAVYMGFQKLESYGLGNWVAGLSPVLQEFVNAAKGDVNQVFWQAIYKEVSHYDAFYISGWIWKFFPYVREYSQQMEGDRMMEVFSYVPNEFLLGDRYSECTLDTRSFPSGISKVKLLWNIHDPETGVFIESREMLVHAGFAGVYQDDDFTLSPCMAWAVCYEGAPAVEHVFEGSVYEKELPHAHQDWLGVVMTESEVMPIYAPETNTSYEDGMTALKAYLEKETGEDLATISIAFTVSWRGTVYNVEVSGADESLQNQMEDLLTHLPYTWSAAESQEPPVLVEGMGPFKVNCRLSL